MNKIKSMIVNVGLFFSALLLVSVAEAETIIRTDGVMTINAGPIWNNADAQRKCPELARNNGGVWTGEWWTTVPGKMSVCQISIGTRPDKKEDPSWNGFSVKYVNGGDLAFSNVKHNQWFEYNAQGAHSFTFREVSRDRWTVYLRDDSRGVNIILDLGRAKIVYSDDTGREFDYRDIVKTSTKAG